MSRWFPRSSFHPRRGSSKMGIRKGSQRKIETYSTKEGFKYLFSEGGMAFLIPLISLHAPLSPGEGGFNASRFKHVSRPHLVATVATDTYRVRASEYVPGLITPCIPMLRMAAEPSLMGNAFGVRGIVQQIGKSLYRVSSMRRSRYPKIYPIDVKRDLSPS